jgi:Ca2+-binding RTX toxin-like protein
MNRSSLLAAATAAAALAAFPAAASANPTGAVNGTTITVTGDGTDETITIGESNNLITLNGSTDLGGSTAAADGTFSLIVNAGAGADTVTIETPNLAAGTINGGDGDDILNGTARNDVMSGGAGNDTLNGADGNDRILGNQGSDTFRGGNGNDELIWNPGDGNDVMDGEGGGGDDAVFNGGDNSEVFAASPNAGRVLFERITGPIELDVGPTTDRLVLNGNGGNDTMNGDPAVTTAMLLNGGVGADVLTAGGGADFLNGNDDNDVLDGGPGIDRIVGDRGTDTMRGAGGDDTLVWNNGDGSDVMDGQDGLDKIEVNGAAGAGDAFTIRADGARARFDRTNLGPFTLDIGTAELLDVRGQGGDDVFVAAAGTPLAVLADGGAGNDALTGADEPDTFFGGSGNDTLTGGPGPDLLDGQDGNDSLLARDGAGDLVRGGLGIDSAQADDARVDVIDGVETIDRPAPADETATPVDVLGRKAAIKFDRRRRASTRVRLHCPAAEAGGCEGRLTLLSRKAFRVAGVKVRLVVGSARFDLDGGERKRVKVRLPKGIRGLARNRKIAVLAQTASRDSAGNLAQKTERLSLGLPKRKRR